MGEIYHLVPESEFRAGVRDGRYAPARLPEDGFVHCAGSAESALAVADDFFSGMAEPLLLLRIDPARLTAKVIHEAPATVAGAGTRHLAVADEFPHVYGPIDLAAITGLAPLGRAAGGFAWPERFASVRELLGAEGEEPE
jgi:uncharacterized protein (DUF952 family)